jgi:hypothetical protein
MQANRQVLRITLGIVLLNLPGTLYEHTRLRAVETRDRPSRTAHQHPAKPP